MTFFTGFYIFNFATFIFFQAKSILKYGLIDFSPMIFDETNLNTFNLKYYTLRMIIVLS